MEGGYICDFSDRTFRNFVLESTGVDVYIDQYTKNGTSKAKRLRTFWRVESDHLASKLIRKMAEYWKIQKMISRGTLQNADKILYEESLKIADRLQAGNPIENIDALQPNSPDPNFSLLANSIKESIEKGEPNQALDRLHTFMMKYMRELCRRHSIPYDKDTPLQGLFIRYKKYLAEEKLIESEMTERILKSFISILDAFNTVRNNQSFAHANPILNSHESTLIVSNISSILKFVGYLETKLLDKKKIPDQVWKEWEDIPTGEEIEAAADTWIQLEIDRMRGK